tara:strand:- start:271 stop:561 length:291 start_codon:yes stop_codon:yes gene_type:complete
MKIKEYENTSLLSFIFNEFTFKPVKKTREIRGPIKNLGVGDEKNKTNMFVKIKINKLFILKSLDKLNNNFFAKIRENINIRKLKTKILFSGFSIQN